MVVVVVVVEGDHAALYRKEEQREKD